METSDLFFTFLPTPPPPPPSSPLLRHFQNSAYIPGHLSEIREEVLGTPRCHTAPPRTESDEFRLIESYVSTVLQNGTCKQKAEKMDSTSIKYKMKNINEGDQFLNSTLFIGGRSQPDVSNDTYYYNDGDKVDDVETSQQHGGPAVDCSGENFARFTLIVKVPALTTRTDLVQAFKRFGQVELAMVVCDKTARHPNREWTATAGYSFVRFKSAIDAQAALAAVSTGFVRIKGSRISATWAKKDSYYGKLKIESHHPQSSQTAQIVNHLHYANIYSNGQLIKSPSRTIMPKFFKDSTDKTSLAIDQGSNPRLKSSNGLQESSSQVWPFDRIATPDPIIVAPSAFQGLTHEKLLDYSGDNSSKRSVLNQTTYPLNCRFTPDNFTGSHFLSTGTSAYGFQPSSRSTNASQRLLKLLTATNNSELSVDSSTNNSKHRLTTNRSSQNHNSTKQTSVRQNDVQHFPVNHLLHTHYGGISNGQRFTNVNEAVGRFDSANGQIVKYDAPRSTEPESIPMESLTQNLASTKYRPPSSGCENNFFTLSNDGISVSLQSSPLQVRHENSSLTCRDMGAANGTQSAPPRTLTLVEAQSLDLNTLPPEMCNEIDIKSNSDSTHQRIEAMNESGCERVVVTKANAPQSLEVELRQALFISRKLKQILSCHLCRSVEGKLHTASCGHIICAYCLKQAISLTCGLCHRVASIELVENFKKSGTQIALERIIELLHSCHTSQVVKTDPAMNEAIDGLPTKWSSLKASNTQSIKSDTRSIKSDTRSIKSDTRSIKSDTRSIKSDTRSLKSYISSETPQSHETTYLLDGAEGLLKDFNETYNGSNHQNAIWSSWTSLGAHKKRHNLLAQATTFWGDGEPDENWVRSLLDTDDISGTPVSEGHFEVPSHDANLLT